MITILAATAGLAAAVPAVASADTYCVYDQPCEDAGGTELNDFAGALLKAKNSFEADRIEIGQVPPLEQRRRVDVDNVVLDAHAGAAG